MAANNDAAMAGTFCTAIEKQPYCLLRAGVSGLRPGAWQLD